MDDHEQGPWLQVIICCFVLQRPLYVLSPEWWILIVTLQVHYDPKQHGQQDARRILCIWWIYGPEQQDQGAWFKTLADAGAQYLNWRVVKQKLSQLKVTYPNGCDTITFYDTWWHACRGPMAVVCSEIGEDFPLQGIQDHLFDSGDENEEEETCECEKRWCYSWSKSLSQMWRPRSKWFQATTTFLSPRSLYLIAQAAVLTLLGSRW